MPQLWRNNSRSSSSSASGPLLSSPEPLKKTSTSSGQSNNLFSSFMTQCSSISNHQNPSTESYSISSTSNGGHQPLSSPPTSPKHYDRLLDELRHAQEKRGRLLENHSRSTPQTDAPAVQPSVITTTNGNGVPIRAKPTNNSSVFNFTQVNSSSPPPLPPPSPPELLELRRNLKPVPPSRDPLDNHHLIFLNGGNGGRSQFEQLIAQNGLIDPHRSQSPPPPPTTPKAGGKKVRFLEDGTGNLHTSVFGGSSESVGSLLDSHQDLAAMSPTPPSARQTDMDDIDSLITSLTNFDSSGLVTNGQPILKPALVHHHQQQHPAEVLTSPTETVSSSSSLGDHHHLLLLDEEDHQAEVVDQRQATVIFHLEPDDPNSVDSGSVLSELDFEETSSTITETYSVITSSPDPIADKHQHNFQLDNDRNDDLFAEVSDLLERSLQEIRQMEDSCSSTSSLRATESSSSSGGSSSATIREPLYELIGWKRRNNPPVQLDLKGAKPFPLPDTKAAEPLPPPPPPPPPVMDDIWVPRQDFIPQQEPVKVTKRPAPPVITNGHHHQRNGHHRIPEESPNPIYGRLWEAGASGSTGSSSRTSSTASGDEVNHPPTDPELSAIRSMARRARLEHWKLTGMPAGTSPTSPTSPSTTFFADPSPFKSSAPTGRTANGIQLTWPPPPIPQSSCSSSATATPVTPTLPPLPAGFGDDPAIQHSSPKCLGHGQTFKWPVPPTNRPTPPVRKSSSSSMGGPTALTRLKPASLDSAQDWYWTEEFPRAAGLEPGTGNMSAWFHGAISRSEAERRLCDRPVGAFLARLTERLWGYALSVRNPSGGVSHFLVDAGGGGPGRRGHHKKYTLLGSADPPHKSLRELIQHYGKNPLSPDGLEKLLFPCPQESAVPCPPRRS